LILGQQSQSDQPRDRGRVEADRNQDRASTAPLAEGAGELGRSGAGGSHSGGNPARLPCLGQLAAMTRLHLIPGGIVFAPQGRSLFFMSREHLVRDAVRAMPLRFGRVPGVQRG
jgi:hypothetical protein